MSFLPIIFTPPRPTPPLERGSDRRAGDEFGGLIPASAPAAAAESCAPARRLSPDSGIDRLSRRRAAAGGAAVSDAAADRRHTSPPPADPARRVPVCTVVRDRSDTDSVSEVSSPTLTHELTPELRLSPVLIPAVTRT